jgi:outer membrane lipoprotein SlyB
MSTTDSAVPIRSSIHPVMWVAAGSVILLSLTGVAAMTGLLPTGQARSGDAVTAGLSTSQAGRPTPRQGFAADNPANHTAEATAMSKQPPRQAASGSARANAAAQTADASAPPAVRNEGTIESIRTVTRKGDASGVGAVAGGVLGAVVGNQFGKGDGRKAMTVVGAAGGALAGNEIEKQRNSTTHVEVAVRMNDGSRRVLALAAQSGWRVGDRVRIDGSGKLTSAG